jgi:6-phosphogluconolactonase (cycloisomerase 2 family)
VLRRDADSGKLEVVQILTDGEDGVEAIAGAFRIACSQDGRHVYVSSGRFQGDQAISVFATQADGKLKLIEEHVNGVGDFTGFEGGNSIAISPGGTLVYAVGTMSDRLVRFQRDRETGKLTFLGSQAVGEFVTPGAAGLCFSPDGKFVYIADENASAIVVLKQP